MGISISGQVGISAGGTVVGNATDQQNILDALHEIRFIASSTSLDYMNGGSASQSIQRWKTLIGEFQIQFITGDRGIFASERSNSLSFNSPDSRIDPGGNTIDLLNRMLDARLLVSVSLERQRAYVFLGGSVRRDYRITSGDVDNNTPVGLFSMHKMRNTADTLTEARDYRNSDRAPMPYPVFFTEGGHALHTGAMINSNSTGGSHGCIREDRTRSQNFARMLWEEVHAINPTSGDFIENAFVFVFDRPIGAHIHRRGDIPVRLFRR